MSVFPRLSFLLINAESPRRISDIRVRRVRLGLDLGRTGNFPRTGRDGSLLAGSGPVAAGVLDATARTPGVLSVNVFSRPLLSPRPPAQGAALGVRPGPLPVRLGMGSLCRRLLLSPFVLLVAFTGAQAFVSALCSPPLLPVGCVLLLVPPVLPFSVGDAGLLASWTPGALRLHQVLQRHGSGLVLPLGALPGARGAVVSLPLGVSLFAHILQGSAVASSLCFSGAWRVLGVIRPAFGGSHGTSGLGVALARLPGLGAGAGGALVVVVVRELLSSGSVRLPAVLLPGGGGPGRPGIPPGELVGGACFGRRRGRFRGREGDGGWRGRRRRPVRYRESGKA